jgi:hypothetical protein
MPSGRPFGTGPGIFGHNNRDEVSVLLLGLAHGNSLWIKTEESFAETLCNLLRDGLEDDNSEVAQLLRGEYSYENVVRYLKAIVPKEKVVAVAWQTVLKIDGNKMQCQLPDGNWLELHPENFEQSSQDPEDLGECWGNRTETYLHQKFRLDPAKKWEIHGRAFFNNGLDYL